MEKWFIVQKGGHFEKISKDYGISETLARLLCNRGVTPGMEMADYLSGDAGRLSDGMMMRDMDKAVELLGRKIKEGKKIRVIGDYDMDGVNASYILYEGLRRMGACVDVDIPERVKDGYGISRGLINQCIADRIDTIITCDNGIAAAEEIDYARSAGMTVIVTDHHQIPYVQEGETKRYILPDAYAVINPHRPDCPYPFKELCGAAVAFQLIRVLAKNTESNPDISDLLENAAIATIGDVMDLVGENRLIAKSGLKMIPETKNVGLRALIEAVGLSGKEITSYHIGFVIGPCINASGRLRTALKAFELFCQQDKQEADRLAGELVELNESRKTMTQKGVEDGVRQIEDKDMLSDTVLVVYLPDCHESLAGIIAGRIREYYDRPSIVLTKSQEGIKGSARSTKQYNMYEELSKCSEMFTKYGGHPMAAGLSLQLNPDESGEEAVEKFRRKINALSPLTKDDLYEEVEIDLPLDPAFMTEELIAELRLLEPCGKGNQRPLFARKNMRVGTMSVRGKNENVLKCSLQSESGNWYTAVYFGAAKEAMEYFKKKEYIDIVYDGRINEYNGRRSVELRILHYR